MMFVVLPQRQTSEKRWSAQVRWQEVALNWNNNNNNNKNRNRKKKKEKCRMKIRRAKMEKKLIINWNMESQEIGVGIYDQFSLLENTKVCAGKVGQQKPPWCKRVTMNENDMEYSIKGKIKGGAHLFRNQEEKDFERSKGSYVESRIAMQPHRQWYILDTRNTLVSWISTRGVYIAAVSKNKQPLGFLSWLHLIPLPRVNTMHNFVL